MVTVGERVSESVPQNASEAAGNPPMDLGSSTEVPESPLLSIRLLSSPSSFDQICAPSQSPTVDSGRFDHLSYDQLRKMRKQRRYNR